MTAIETRHIDATQQQVDTQTSGLIATDPWSVVN